MRRVNVERVIEAGFSCLLHGKLINWPRLLKDLEYRKLTPAQRRKEEVKKMDTAMQAYWNKAVAYVEDPDIPHPGKLIEQDFVYSRQMKVHEVDAL